MAKEPILNGKRVLIPAGAMVTVLLAIATIWGGYVWGSVSDNTESLQEIKEDNVGRDVRLDMLREDLQEVKSSLKTIENLLREQDE
jgi:hypothetical protein